MTPPTARRPLPISGALLVALLCALLGTLSFGATPAAAHAALTATDPADGSVVKTAPQRVKLTFSEGVLLSADSLRVLDPQGKRVEEGRAAHADGASDTATVALRGGLADGTYTVAWQAVSADSHPVGGAFTFSIGAPSKTTVKAPAADVDPTVNALYGIGRYAAYAGFVLLVGGCVFAGVSRSSRPVQKIAVGGWVTLFASTTALLLLRGAYTNTKGLGSVLDFSLLGGVLSTKPGAALLSRLLLLSAAAVFLAVLFGSYAPGDAAAASREKREKERKGDAGAGRRGLGYGLAIGGAVVATGLAATWSLAEHASVGIQPYIAMPVDILHLLAVGVWLGGLVALLVTLRSDTPIRRAAVQRFSRLAFASVCVLVATGTYQAWRQVGTWGALTGTAYGRWLLIKVGLVAVVVGLAYFSRRWTNRLADRTDTGGKKAKAVKAVKAAKAAERARSAEKAKVAVGGGSSDERTAQLARQRAAMDRAAGQRRRDADENRTGLRRSVLAETGVAVVLLAVTTVLSGTQPGRAETEQKQAAAGSSSSGAASAGPVDVKIPYDTGGTDGRGTARITIDPARSGDNTVEAHTTGPSGRPVDVPELDISLTEKEKKIGPLHTALKRQSAGHWKATGFQLPMAGSWQLTLTVRTSDIDQVTEIKNVKIN
ncbi:copper resistance CopC/CopD family protein [Streptomyces sp. NPDC057654]|uniref:copper resistance CopC/CopD family protein n=1 Tax=Streptomyces sp. NPDC057654 TaxID=3346196 RepID=UPI0036A9083A